MHLQKCRVLNNRDVVYIAGSHAPNVLRVACNVNGSDNKSVLSHSWPFMQRNLGAVRHSDAAFSKQSRSPWSSLRKVPDSSTMNMHTSSHTYLPAITRLHRNLLDTRVRHGANWPSCVEHEAEWGPRSDVNDIKRELPSHSTCSAIASVTVAQF